MIITKVDQLRHYIIFYNDSGDAFIAISSEGHEDTAYDGLYRYDNRTKILGVDLI